MHLKNSLRRIRKKLLSPFDRTLRRLKASAEKFVVKTVTKHGVMAVQSCNPVPSPNGQPGVGMMDTVKQVFAFMKASQSRSHQASDSFQAVPLGDGLMLVAHPHVGYMYADMSDVVLLPKLVLGQYEEEKTIALETTVQRGDTVLHIDCEQGYHLLTIAKLVGPTGQIIAVDDQYQARAFNLNVRAHQLDSRVTVVADAVRLQQALRTVPTSSSRLVICVPSEASLDPALVPVVLDMLRSSAQVAVIVGTDIVSTEQFAARLSSAVPQKYASAA